MKIEKSLTTMAGLLAVVGVQAARLVNGSFETGGFEGWTVRGEAQVVGSYRGYSGTIYYPQHGQSFALLWAGQGNGVATTASQSIFLNAGETIAGRAAFSGRDYLPFNDNAQVNVTVLQGTSHLVFYQDIAAVGNFGDGPWTTWTFTAPESSTYTVEYGVVNIGDNALPSAAVFDGPSDPAANLQISSQAPPSRDRGSQFDIHISYQNLGELDAHNSIATTVLPLGLNPVSISGSGIYDSGSRTITWNLGTMAAGVHGDQVVTVSIPPETPIGTIFPTESMISTSDVEVSVVDNTWQTFTRVTGPTLPPNTSVEPNFGGETPTVFWGAPVTFSYSSSCATSVDIVIHVEDGGPDIIAPMAGGPPNWTYTTTFYPRHGATTVTYTLHGCDGGDHNVNFNIYIDPAGYIYDAETGARIAGASVWLQIPDGFGGWVNAPTGLNPAISQPDTNPLITGSDGQYQWDVLAGLYRVHVEAPGYYPADSRVVTIPPPVFDLHVGLVLKKPDLKASSYSLVSSKRITRDVWEYTYGFNLRNIGPGNATSVTATLQDVPSQVTVIDGSVSFGSVPAGSTVSGGDTFKVRIDRRYKIANSVLKWRLDFVDAGGTSRTVVDLPLF